VFNGELQDTEQLLQSPFIMKHCRWEVECGFCLTATIEVFLWRETGINYSTLSNVFKLQVWLR